MYGNTGYVQGEFAESALFENWLRQWYRRLKQHTILTHLKCILNCGGASLFKLKKLQDTPSIFDRK